MLNPIRRRLIDRMVLRPSRHAIDPGILQRIELQWSGGPLECYVQRHESSQRHGSVLVVKFPGTSGRAEQSTGLPLSLLPEVGGSTWTWNPPGYGGSSGRASLPLIAAAAIEFTRQVIEREADDDTTIWLAGNSLGCATAMNVAAALEFDHHRTGLVLRNPPPLVDVVKHVAGQYPLGRLLHRLAESVHAPMNILKTATQVQLPAVFFQSGADTLVPPEMQRRVIEAYGGEHQVIVMQDLSHDGVADSKHEQEMRRSLHWLLQQTGYLHSQILNEPARESSSDA